MYIYTFRPGLTVHVVCQDGLVQNKPYNKTMKMSNVAVVHAVVDPDQLAEKSCQKYRIVYPSNLSPTILKHTLRYLHPAFGRNCQGSLDSSSSILVPIPSNELFRFSFELDNIDEPSCKITRRLFVLFSSS